MTNVINNFKKLFNGNPLFSVVTPGRVDLMGSHTDYNHGYVVTMPVDLKIECAFAPCEGDILTLHSCRITSYNVCYTKLLRLEYTFNRPLGQFDNCGSGKDRHPCGH